MVKKLIFGSVLFLLLITPVVFAMDTKINIKTMPNHEVQVTILGSSSSSLVLERFRNNSDEYGDISFIYSSDTSKFGLIVFIKKDGEKVISEKFTEDYIVGDPVYIKLAPDWFEFIDTPVNETVNATIENTSINETEPEISIEEIEEEKGSEITGSAIFGDEGFLSKKTIYYGLGVFVLLIGFIALTTIKRKSKVPKEIKIKKLSEVMDEKRSPKASETLKKASEENLNSNEEIIADAERKIKEAQEDIRKIKNEDKIKEAKKKLIEDEKELMRLRQGKE